MSVRRIGMDYVLVAEATWHMLHAWYGGRAVLRPSQTNSRASEIGHQVTIRSFSYNVQGHLFLSKQVCWLLCPVDQTSASFRSPSNDFQKHDTFNIAYVLLCCMQTDIHTIKEKACKLLRLAPKDVAMWQCCNSKDGAVIFRNIDEDDECGWLDLSSLDNEIMLESKVRVVRLLWVLQPRNGLGSCRGTHITLKATLGHIHTSVSSSMCHACLPCLDSFSLVGEFHVHHYILMMHSEQQEGRHFVCMRIANVAANDRLGTKSMF